MKPIKLVLVLMVGLFLFTGCANALEKYNSPVDPSDETEYLVEIPSGATSAKIANLLYDQDLIQNVNAFKSMSKSLGLDGSMQAGMYHLKKSMSQQEIIEKIASGETYVETYKFTIPEGYEVRQMIEKLSNEGIVDKDIFENALINEPFDFTFLEGVDRQYMLEGYLFPDTYIVKKGTSETEIIYRMLSRFDEVFIDDYYKRASELDMSVDEVVTLASIIERETKSASELSTVSSVFHNRIDRGQKLESCATIQYVLKERKERLTYDDLAIESPYNSYIYKGLPPAPIASPGEKAIIAALYPEDTNYLFFVTRGLGDGSHYFNETLAGHNRDKEKGKQAENGQ